uniref:Proline-rich protein 36-like n=1 Tax=Echinococcus granulosus TaxID=6210 RepID=U6FR37_ECHGR|nr:hypothetical protein EgrG_000160800 [Echinococcus granulosus]
MEETGGAKTEARTRVVVELKNILLLPALKPLAKFLQNAAHLNGSLRPSYAGMMIPEILLLHPTPSKPTLPNSPPVYLTFISHDPQAYALGPVPPLFPSHPHSAVYPF